MLNLGAKGKCFFVQFQVRKKAGGDSVSSLFIIPSNFRSWQVVSVGARHASPEVITNDLSVRAGHAPPLQQQGLSSKLKLRHHQATTDLYLTHSYEIPIL